MYYAKWFDVVHYLYEMPVVSGMGFLGMTKARWDKLDPDTQAFLDEQSKAFADKTWSATKEDEQQGIACLTGETLGGPSCRHGEPAKMKLVRTSAEDAALRTKVLDEFVLKRFGERCGAECSAAWDKTAGAAVAFHPEISSTSMSTEHRRRPASSSSAPKSWSGALERA